MGWTHDCVLLEPLAFPPDLPPVILNLGCDEKDVSGNWKRDLDCGCETRVPYAAKVVW